MLRSGKDVANAPMVLAQSGGIKPDGHTSTDRQVTLSGAVVRRSTGEDLLNGSATSNSREVVNGHGAAASNSHGQRQQRPVSASGRHFACQIKAVASFLALSALVMSAAMAVMYYHFDVLIFRLYSRRADMGSGTLWIPPDKRPVPLSAFPDFSGSGLNRKELSRGGDIGSGGGTDVTEVVAGGRPPTLLFHAPVEVRGVFSEAPVEGLGRTGGSVDRDRREVQRPGSQGKELFLWHG